jgi:hypothetical protein
MTAFTNRKKIRGWRYQIKKIENWYLANYTPNTEKLSSWNDEYIKIWIDPWYRLVKRNPPLWYFRLILDKLVNLYDLWNMEFTNEDKPYDLQLWLFENNYIESELVSTRVENKNEKRNNFFIQCKSGRTFPMNKFNSKNFNYLNFEWSLNYATRDYFIKSDNLSESEIKNLIKRGFNQEIIYKDSENEEVHFWKPYDYVWIGRKIQKNDY